MASHQISLDIDPSFKDLISSWQSSKNKIRRPPNAFMLFGKHNRKRLALENPHVSNKVISEMLGKNWSEAPNHIKEEYYKNARIIRSLHAKMFPGYHYSPVEARRKKAEKRNKCTEAELIARGETMEEKTILEARDSLGYWTRRQYKRRERNSQEDESKCPDNKADFSQVSAIQSFKVADRIDEVTQLVPAFRDIDAGKKNTKCDERNLGAGSLPIQKDIFKISHVQSIKGEIFGLNDEVAASVEYVPNNPENFLQLYDEETSPGSENQPTDLDASLRGHESGPSRSERHLYCSPSYTMGVSSPSIPSKSSSSYCSPTEYCPGSTSSDSYENTVPQYYPFCNSRLLLPYIPSKLSSPYCSPTDYCPGSTSSDSYENTAPQYYPYCNSRLLSPYIPSKLSSPYCSPTEYCPGSTSSDSYENTAPQCYPYCNSRLLRAPLSCQMQDGSHQGLRSRDEGLSNPCNSSNDGFILGPSYLTSGYLPCFDSDDERLEIDDGSETSSSCDSDSETAQATNE